MPSYLLPHILLTTVPFTALLAFGVFFVYVILLRFILYPINITKEYIDQPLPPHRFFGWTFWRKFLLIARWHFCNVIIPAFICGVMVVIFLATFWEPSFFSHNLFYDIFILRTNNDSLAAAHWTSYALVTGLFVYLMHYWVGLRNTVNWFTHGFKDIQVASAIFKATLFSAFLVFFHESMWFIFYFVKEWSTNTLPVTDVLIGDCTFVIMITTFFVSTRIRYREEVSWYYLPAYGIYAAFLASWYFFDNMNVTTVPVFINNVATAQATKFYYDPLTNVLEVMGWVLAFCLIVGIVRLNHEKYTKPTQGKSLKLLLKEIIRAKWN